MHDFQAPFQGQRTTLMKDAREVSLASTGEEDRNKETQEERKATMGRTEPKRKKYLKVSTLDHPNLMTA